MISTCADAFALGAVVGLFVGAIAMSWLIYWSEQ